MSKLPAMSDLPADFHALLPMWGDVIRPGESREICASPGGGYPVALSWLCLADPEKFSTRVILRDRARRTSDLALVDRVWLFVDHQRQKSARAFAPRTIARPDEEIFVRASYVGENPEGEKFCGALWIGHLDPSQPGRTFARGSCPTCAQQHEVCEAEYALHTSSVGWRWAENRRCIEAGKPLPHALSPDEVADARRLACAVLDAEREERRIGRAVLQSLGSDAQIRVDPEFEAWE